MNIKNIINKIGAVVTAGLVLINTVPMVSSASETTASTAKVTIDAVVAVNGDTPDKDNQEEFKIVLAYADGDKDTIETVTTTGGRVEFKTITYDSPGVHNYTVSETKGSANGYTYDTKVYDVKVSIVNEGGELSTIYTVREQGEQNKRSSMVFVNSYKAASEASEDEESPTPTPSPEPSPSPSPEPESSSTTESSTTPETTTQPATVPAPTPTKPTQPSTTPATESPNRPSDSPRIEREEIPNIPVYEDLVADSNNPEYVSLAPDPVPLVSLTSLDDEETPKAVLISDEDVPLAVMTGDAFNMILWIALLAVSGIVIVLIFASKLKAGKNNK